ncbi:hypothetical protein A2704_03465 [Candidatus Kaiserbacteria bacterium RIFCSPHIGHO2_01_FULL_54_36b]|uniref:Glycosyl transferase family 1 domain-containing protein n=1 Tax=Candidatus Kaiserbacteria bacterium RIFCSPHIGHO2_01_FULL_54_36b TaxID=1798483 RepID=A0A1F6CQN4_9BACT|nr:MAG: hypothetical protein A2704_03465 [Candidatus Kaiserbacteria bacterium RIFCSPHIGHO2_01_FULL_54_36b]
MKILWLTWKDKNHPRAGGAEVVNEELAKRLVRDGHEVKFLVAGYKDAMPEEIRDGFAVVRIGNRFSVYWRVYRYYKKHLQEWPDLVIDEMNTIPFFAKFYAIKNEKSEEGSSMARSGGAGLGDVLNSTTENHAGPRDNVRGERNRLSSSKQKNILFVHQLARQIWFYEMPFPFSLIGYLVEPLYLWLLNDRQAVTVSLSTRRDLVRFGFKEEKVHIISEGIELEPVADLKSIQKFERPTILALGAIRPMKRTHHIVRAFELLRRTIPNARLIIAGEPEGRYGKSVLAQAKSSIYARDIECIGRVSPEKKRELLGTCHFLLCTSVKEGWGLVVTEANSQGTPAVVYDVDGLRDSVKNAASFEAGGEVGGSTGIITKKNTPAALAQALAQLLVDESAYAAMQKRGWEWSKEITFDKSYRQFAEILKYV